MASVFKRGKRWYGSWKGAGGNRVKRVLPGVRSKRDAERIAAEKELAAWQIRENGADPVDNSALVADILEGFLLHKLATRRYATVQFYRSALADMLGTFHRREGTVWPPDRQTPVEEVKAMAREFTPGSLGTERVSQITPELVEQYVEGRRNSVSVRTLNKAVVGLKTMLKWARKGRKIKTNAVAEMSRAGKPARRHRALDVDEVERLLEVSPEPSGTLWLAFVTTGLRKGEMVQLRWPQVDLDTTNTIRVVAGTSKSKRQRDVPIVPDLRAKLLRLRAAADDPEGYVFTNERGMPWISNLSRRFDRCVERALVGEVVRRDTGWHIVYHEDGKEVDEPLPGIKGWKNAKAELRRRRGHKAKGVTLHTLRHTYATQLLLNGVNPKIVSDLLGHAGIQITLDIYGHVFPRNKQEAVKALPFGNGPRVSQEGEGRAQLTG